MLKYIEENIAWIISSIVTIVGFFVTYFMMKKSIKDEILKTKTVNAMEKMQDVPKMLLDLFEKAKSKTLDVKDLANTYNTITAYGSSQSVRILVVMQSLQYQNMLKGNDLLFLLSILVSQVKFDLTGEIMFPSEWLAILIYDFEKIKTEAESKINIFIKTHGFNRKLIIKEAEKTMGKKTLEG